MEVEERKFRLAFGLAEQESFLTLSRRAYARALSGGTDEAAGGLYVCLLLATASKPGFSGEQDSGIAAIRVFSSLSFAPLSLPSASNDTLRMYSQTTPLLLSNTTDGQQGQ